jgi:hypothetical protein
MLKNCDRQKLKNEKDPFDSTHMISKVEKFRRSMTINPAASNSIRPSINHKSSKLIEKRKDSSSDDNHIKIDDKQNNDKLEVKTPNSKNYWLNSWPFIKSISAFSQSRKSSSKFTSKHHKLKFDNNQNKKESEEYNENETPRHFKNQLAASKSFKDSLVEPNKRWYLFIF